MKKDQDYRKDLAEIRSMMERSSKFLSLSGWAGILAGIYALAGTLIVAIFTRFNPLDPAYTYSGAMARGLRTIIILAAVILLLSVISALFLSMKRAKKNAEPLWNEASRRLILQMAVPLVTGGILLLVLLAQGLSGLLAPLSLIFYGLALYNAGHHTFKEVRVLGIIQVVLGLLASFWQEYGLIFWGGGFGLMHITYGIYIHVKYQR